MSTKTRQQKNVYQGSDKPALTAHTATSHNKEFWEKHSAFKTPTVAK